jgi:DNA-binding CsgD family transcriptional regulator
MLATQSIVPVAAAESPCHLRLVEDSPRLSPREAEVLGWLKLGLSEKEVAEELSVSTHTVHTYVKGLYRMFEVRTRAELMAWCLAGLRPPDRYRRREWAKT